MTSQRNNETTKRKNIETSLRNKRTTGQEIDGVTIKTPRLLRN